jgi:hypothetical protein
MRRSSVVPMRWMVIYEYEGPGGTLNLSSTKLPRPWQTWKSSPSRKNSHGRTGNRTQDLMISSQKLWPLDHEAGLCNKNVLIIFGFYTVRFVICSWETNKCINLIQVFFLSYLLLHVSASSMPSSGSLHVPTELLVPSEPFLIKCCTMDGGGF